MNPENVVEGPFGVRVLIVEARQQTVGGIVGHIWDEGHRRWSQGVTTTGNERGSADGARFCAPCAGSGTANTFGGRPHLLADSPTRRSVDYYEPTARQFEREIVDLRRRLLWAFGLLIGVTIIGIVGFSVIDPSAGVIRAFFMTAITLTTVGYGEEIPVDTDGARVFTAILILAGMGATLYFISTGTAFLLEGQLGHVFRRKRMQRDLERLEGHMIVCGSGPTALYAATELSRVERPVVLVAATAAELEELRADVPEVPIVVGDPTDDEVLLAAGVDRAAGLIAGAERDNENVVITLTARQLNPRIRIVARLQDIDQESKARKVGANSVVSPQHIGGLRLASELVRPAVVDFLDEMLKDRERNLRIDELRIAEDGKAAGRTLRDLRLEDFPGVLLLAIRDVDGSWEYNPPRDRVVLAGQVLIYLGSPEDSRDLRSSIGQERKSPAR